jgi:hypothetical protein
MAVLNRLDLHNIHLVVDFLNGNDGPQATQPEPASENNLDAALRQYVLVLLQNRKKRMQALALLAENGPGALRQQA